MKGIAITTSGVTRKFTKIDCDAGVCMIRFSHIYYKDIVGQYFARVKNKIYQTRSKNENFY